MNKKMRNTAILSGLLMATTAFPMWSVNAEAAELANEQETVTESVSAVQTEEKAGSKYASKVVNPEDGKQILSEKVWKPEVKADIEDLLGPYATGEIKIPHKPNKGPKIKNIPYAILNVDEAAGINAAQEQVLVYQLNKLAFAMTPEKMREVLQTGMTDQMTHAVYGAEDGKGRELLLSAVMDDAVSAYSKLYDAKLVKASGSDLSDEAKTDDYYEFTTKMLWLYHAINATQGADIAKPWAGYWFTGMAPYDAYNVTVKGIELYGDYVDENAGVKPSKKKKAGIKPELDKDITLKSPKMNSNAGTVSVTYHSGINSTKEIAQLVKAIQNSGLDVWVVSSANYEIARACLNYYHVPGADGILAMRTKVDKNGCYVNEYNYKYHPATYYKDGMLAAIKENITGYYYAKQPAILAEDEEAEQAAGSVNLHEVYPASKLFIKFKDGKAVETVKFQPKKK